MPGWTPVNQMAGQGFILSESVYTLQDIARNQVVGGWFTVEFRQNYVTGGLVVDLSYRLRQIDIIIARAMSGAYSSSPKENDTDFPGDPRSGRIMLFLGITVGAYVYPIEVPNATPISGARVQLYAVGY